MTTTTAPVVASDNPFVGPRSFGRNERIHGRDREIRELLNLVVADRIVLCYSPSGAGKTSLIEAGLAPKLEDEGFTVLPTIRLKNEPPAGSEVNRYVASAMVCLGLPPGLPGDTLRERLTQVSLDEARTGLLVFDQFEEVLSLDPTDGLAKRKFFSQLGDLLRDRRWWALFAMREDFLAALDPYLPLIPTRLSTRFRLDLLSPEAARQVVTRTVEAAGRTFAADASTALVTELSRMVDGRIGPYIEPVQLQVVCRQLWERLPSDVREITTANMGDVGDVDGALAAYYAREVRSVAGQTDVGERAVRDWFERQLLTDRGLRGQTQTGPDGDGQVVRLLQDSHLVRAESRRGTTWYELAHDRLVAPIRADNEAWAEQHLNVFQRQAQLWEEQGRRDDLLVTDEVLDQGEALATTPDAGLSPAETSFLEACRRTRAAAQRERHSVRRTRQLLALASIGLVVAVVASMVAFSSSRRAQRARDRAEAGERLRLAAPALDMVDVDPNLSVHLALLALARTDAAEDEAGLVAQHVLLERIQDSARIGLTFPVHARRVSFSPDGSRVATAGDDGAALWDARQAAAGPSDDQPVNDLTFTPDGRHVAVVGDDRHVAIFDVVDDQDGIADVTDEGITAVVEKLPSKGKNVTGVAFSPDGRRFAIATGDGTLVWEWERDATAGEPLRLSGGVRTVAFTPDGKTIATTGDDGTVKLSSSTTDATVDPGTGREPRILRGHTGPVNDVVFSPDGAHLVTGGSDGTARLWAAASGDSGRVLTTHAGGVEDVAFSRDGRRVATAGMDGTARVIDTAAGREVFRADPGTGAATGVSFDPNGPRLAVATADGAPAMWDVGVEEPPGHRGNVYAAAFSPDGDAVATASADHSAVVWNLDGSLRSVLTGHEGEVNTVRFGAGGAVATGSDDFTARLWEGASGREVRTFSGHDDSVYDVALSPDGGRLATASQDGTAKIWDVGTGAEAMSIPAGGPLNGVALSPDGRRLATAGDDGAKVWDLSTGRLVRSLSSAEVEGFAQRVAFSPDGTLLAASFDGGTVVWDAATGRERRAFAADDGLPLIAGISFSPDGTRLVSADGVVRDVSSWNPVATTRRGQGVAFNHDGTTIAVVGEGHTAQVFDAATGRLLRPLGAEAARPLDPAIAIATNVRRGRLATANMDGTATLWDLAGRPLRTIAGDGTAVSDVGLSPDGRRLVTAGDDGAARVWDVDSGDQLAALAAPMESPAKHADGPRAVTEADADEPDADGVTEADAEEPVARVRFVGDGNTIVTAGVDGGAWLWDVRRPSAPRLLRSFQGQVLGLSDNGRWIAIGRASTLVVLDVRSGQTRGSFRTRPGLIAAASVSANGKRVVVMPEEGVPRVGDVQSGSAGTLRPLDAPTSAPEEFFPYLALSADGRQVATATDDGDVVVWDVRSREITFEVETPAAGGVIAFASDDRLVAAGEGTPVVYPVTLPELKKLAAQRAARPLTDEECQRYLQSDRCTP